MGKILSPGGTSRLVALCRLIRGVEAALLQFLCIGMREDVVTCEDAPDGVAGANPDHWLKVSENII